MLMLFCCYVIENVDSCHAVCLIFVHDDYMMMFMIAVRTLAMFPEIRMSVSCLILFCCMNINALLLLLVSA
jgi:hypothetical protein